MTKQRVLVGHKTYVLQLLHYYVFVGHIYIVLLLNYIFILSVISPCTTGFKALYDQFGHTSAVQLSNY